MLNDQWPGDPVEADQWPGVRVDAPAPKAVAIPLPPKRSDDFPGYVQPAAPVPPALSTPREAIGSATVAIPAPAPLDTGANVPETDQTISDQLQQLADGRRKAVMYPKGTDPVAEEDMPDGMAVMRTPRGTFHYNPALTTPEQIRRAVRSGSENELLALGPYSKPDVQAIQQQTGEPSVAVTERTPDGSEVKAAAGTPSTAPAQVSALDASKTPGNTVQVEDPAKVIANRAGIPEPPRYDDKGNLLPPIGWDGLDQKPADRSLADRVRGALDRVKQGVYDGAGASDLGFSKENIKKYPFLALPQWQWPAQAIDTLMRIPGVVIGGASGAFGGLSEIETGDTNIANQAQREAAQWGEFALQGGLHMATPGAVPDMKLAEKKPAAGAADPYAHYPPDIAQGLRDSDARDAAAARAAQLSLPAPGAPASPAAPPEPPAAAKPAPAARPPTPPPADVVRGEDDTLRRAGFTDEDIGAMDPAERTAHLKDAGITEPSPGTRANPAKVETANDLRAAETQAEPPKSMDQAQAENYRHAHVEVEGLDVAIETPKGEVRRGVDADGNPWATTMPAAYGRIKGTVGADGAPLDIYIGDKPGNGKMYVIDQQDPKSREFDEHKIVTGVDTLGQAIRLYHQAFSDGSGIDRNMHASETTPAGLKEWIANGDTTKPFRDYTPAPSHLNRFSTVTPLVDKPTEISAPVAEAPKPRVRAPKEPAKPTAAAETPVAPKGRESSAEKTGVEKAETPVVAAEGESESSPGWKHIGENADGMPLYEDARGVRSVVQEGIRSTESVRLRPKRDGTKEIDLGNRHDFYKTTAEKEPPEHAIIDAMPPEAKKAVEEAVEKVPEPAKEPAPKSDELAYDHDNISFRYYGKVTPRSVRATPGLAGRIGQHRVIGERKSPWSVVDGFGDTMEEARDNALRQIGVKIPVKEPAHAEPEGPAASEVARGDKGVDGPAKEDQGPGEASPVSERREEPQGDSHEPEIRVNGGQGENSGPAGNGAVEEKSDGPSKLDEPGARALEGVPADAVQGVGREPKPTGGVEGRGGADLHGNDGAGAGGVSEPRGVGDGEGAVPVPARGSEVEGGAGPRAGGERGGEDVQRGPEANEPGSPRTGDDPAAGRPGADTGSDFAITDADKIGEGGAKTKFKQNLDAIRVLRRLEQTAEKATAEDQAVLAKYVGWGGLPQAFERSDKTFTKGWEKEAAALRDLLTPEEFAAAEASTRNAHYTSPEIIKGMWDAVRRLGFDRGRVLEPSVGVGNFFGLMPAGMRSASALHGVELDHITGGIAKHLYPAAKIAAPMGFQNYTIPDGYFDLVIGNPPFGAEKLYDPLRKDLSKFSIHNYFFAKAMDGLRPGGVMSMVVTNRMLDSASDAARKYLSDRADLVAAIRLPNNAFLKNAGTEVTTDIVILRKRGEGEMPSDETWDKIVDYRDHAGNVVPLNEYFARHPENMLGDFGAYGTMYRPDDPALVAREGQDTSKLLKEAIGRLPKGITRGSEHVPTKESIPVTADLSTVRVGSMFVQDGKVLIRDEDQLGEPRASAVEFPNDRAAERVGGMLKVRDSFADLRRLQLSNTATPKQIEAARADLNKTYDGFVKEHGFINSDANRRLFIDDPSWPNISALEDGYNKGISAAVAKRTGEQAIGPSARKAAVFTRRTQSPYSPPTSAGTAKDALVASLSDKGRVDLEAMQALYGKDPETILKELGDLVFNDPVHGLVPADEYLSGNVKQKLAAAMAKAKTDPAFARNIEALKAVQPADVRASDIDVKLGAHWVPPTDMTDFVNLITEPRRPARAIYNPAMAAWTIQAEASPSATTKWGTNRMRPAGILEAAANQKSIRISDKMSDGTYQFNEVETQAANDKVNALKDEWKQWVFEDDGRRERLGRLYNDMFNTNVQRRYDGSHLTFPGKVGDDIIDLRPHQKNGIWRILQSPTTLADHVVGAGKTFTLIGAAMEGRRMGLMKKPLFTVPNHLVGQWAADFARLYPGANILAATKKDFEADNRKRLFARIATGDWDAVIVAHSSFGKIEVDPAAQNEFIENQVADYMASETAMREAEGKDSRNVKKIQARITMLREKQKRLLDTGAKDNSIYWKELGIDALFLDEAHEFKNLEYSTSMQRVAGLGAMEGSQKASDMYLKVNQVLKATGGRNVTFATGTPISNTMAEMFTIQRYLDGKALAEQGLTHFDAWARMYGEVVNDWELSPAGKYKLNSRFSKFVNMPELMQRYQSFADVITRDDINAQLALQGKKLPIPKIKGGKPQNIVVQRSQDQANYIGEPLKDPDGNETDSYPQGSLVWRSENLPKRPGKGEDNMLKVMSDARKAALDMRLIDPSYPDAPGSKVNEAANRIKTLYDKWAKDRGAQLVFIDLSTPKAARGREAQAIRDLVEKAEAGDEAAQTRLDAISPDELSALDSQFSVYDDLRQKLIDKGIPPNEIEFIHSANTDQQKADLFGKVRSGQIRVLLGSTAKMGAGMNVQDRLVALHHLDAPWRPSDLEQREGRIIRQGNQLYERDPEGFEIEINRYATKQTLDSRMWQTIEGKANFIEQVRKGAGTDRTIEDVAGEAANAAEMKAAASGNPLILEEMALRNAVKKLTNEEYAYRSEQYRVRDTIKRNVEDNASAEREIANRRADLKIPVPEEFSVNIGGHKFDKRKDAGEAIIAALKKLQEQDGREMALGTYGGFKLVLDRSYGITQLILKGATSYSSTSFKDDSDPVGIAQRITHTVPTKGDIALSEERIATRKSENVKLQKQLGPWGKTDELAAAKARHSEIIAQLRPKKQAPAPADGEATTETATPRRAPRAQAPLPDYVQRETPERQSQYRRIEAFAQRLADELFPAGHGVRVEVKGDLRASGDTVRASGGAGDKAYGLFSSEDVERTTTDARGNVVKREALVRRLVQIAADAKDPIEAIMHEFGHVAQDMGLKTPTERATIENEADALRKIAARRYGAGAANMPLHELEANALGEYLAAKARADTSDVPPTAPPIIARLGDRLWRFFTRLRNMLKQNGFMSLEGWRRNLRGEGFETSTDIFDRMSRGEFRGRDLGESEIPRAESAMAKPMNVGQKTGVREVATKITEATADSMVRMREVEKTKDPTVTESPYLKETLSQGRTQAQIEDLIHGSLDVIAKDLRKSDISREAFDKYIYARGAERRNEIIAERRNFDPNWTEGSGMSDADAKAIMASVAASGKQADYDRNASRVYQLLASDLDRRVAAGLMTRKQADGWQDYFGPDYVPLKGWEGVEEGSGQIVGRKYSVHGDEARNTVGRGSRADSPLVRSLDQARQGIVRAERNRVAVSVYKFAVQDAASAAPTGIFEVIKRPPNREILDKATGLVRSVPDRRFRDDPNVVVAKIGGDERYVKVKNDALAHELKNMLKTDPDAALQGIQQALSVYSRMRTSWNPRFAVKNFVRDHQDALSYAMIKIPHGMRLFEKNLPSALAESANYVWRGRSTPMFDQFRHGGGRVTYAKVRSLEQSKRRISRMMASPWRPDNLVMNSLHVLENWSDQFETATRYAIYRAAREAGQSHDEASSHALEATLNFYRHGSNTLMRYVAATQPFLNANIQSPLRAGRLIRDSKRGAISYLALLPMIGAGVAIWNYMMGGNDTDGRPFADKIPEYEHERNLVIYSGQKDAHGRPIAAKLPSFPEFTGPFALGRLPVAMMLGKDPVGDYLGNTTKALWNIAPMARDWLGVFSVFNQIYSNKNFFGGKVHWEAYPNQKGLPNSEIVRPDTDKAWQEIARLLAKAGGGDRTHKPVGLLDLHPEDVKLLTRELAGSFYGIMDGIAGVAGSDPESKGVAGLLGAGDYVMPGSKHAQYDANKFFEAAGEQNVNKLEAGRKGRGNTNDRDKILRDTAADTKKAYATMNAARASQNMSPEAKAKAIQNARDTIDFARRKARQQLQPAAP